VAGQNMHYVYILFSESGNRFYVGSTENIDSRLALHNSGKVFATKPYAPWTLEWYAGFQTRNKATAFEKYLKTGSGRAFLYKRLADTEALKKHNGMMKSVPKLS
jgi:predicted GIY-YIG superfamily endonuclease